MMPRSGFRDVQVYIYIYGRKILPRISELLFNRLLLVYSRQVTPTQ